MANLANTKALYNLTCLLATEASSQFIQVPNRMRVIRTPAAEAELSTGHTELSALLGTRYEIHVKLASKFVTQAWQTEKEQHLGQERVVIGHELRVEDRPFKMPVSLVSSLGKQRIKILKFFFPYRSTTRLKKTHPNSV